MAETLHASAVAIGNRAVVILGPAGSGKSGLALDLISRGAVLVADDRVALVATPDGPPRAAPMPALEGRIEARGLGLLRTDWRSGVPVALAVDLSEPEPDRLPRPRSMTLAGHSVPLLAGRDTPNLAAAIHVALSGGLERHD